MNYEKNYNVGNIRLDTPYTHFVYELPLLSFGDVLHTVNLSLVYQSKMSGNPYSIAPGFGLNLQKKLSLSQDDNPSYYESGNGEKILLNNCDGKYVFDDGSQRIIRGTVLENPDFSTENYNSLGNIMYFTDKYENKLLEYQYYGAKLLMVSYRPDVTNKKISFAYNDSGKLESISYLLGTQVICTTNLVYLDNGGIKVQHYSGVDYYIIPTETSFNVYSRDYGVTESKSYYHSIECNISTDALGNKAIVANSLVDTSVVDSVTYNFLSPINGKINVLDVTNFHGVTTRTQYIEDKPRYSYELSEGMFETRASELYHVGNVNYYNNDQVVGKQSYGDGISMTRDTTAPYVASHHFYVQQSISGLITVSGWLKPLYDIVACTIIIDDGNGNASDVEITGLVKDVWNYFSVTPNMNYASSILHVYTSVTDANMEACDFRVSMQGGGVSDHFTRQNDVLFDEEHDMRVIFNKDSSFYNGTNALDSTTYPITANDIAKYIINQKLGTHKNEIYYNNCRGVISNAGAFTLEYPKDSNGTPETCNIATAGFGKIYCKDTDEYVSKSVFVTQGDIVFLKHVETKNGNASKNHFYDDKLDLTFSTEESNSLTSYVRNAYGLITHKEIKAFSSDETIATYAEYDDDCTELLTTTDEFGVVTKYTTDPTWGVVTKTVLRNQDNTADEFIVTDTFDADLDTQLGRNFTKDGLNEKEHNYKYDEGRLSELTDGSLKYEFTYSAAGDIFQVVKNSNLLEVHTVDNNRRSFTTNYGSHSVTENYDKYGRLAEISGQIQNEYDINPTASGDAFSTVGKDNSDAKLSKSTDLVTGNVTKYAYEKDRVSRIGVFNSNNTQTERETFGYDSIGRITSSAFTYDNMSKSVQSDITYATEEDSPVADSRVSVCSYKVNGTEKAKTLNRYNDSYKRLTAKLVTIGGYTYDKGFTYNKTRISKVMDVKNGSTFHNVSYGYDVMGRITSESDSTDTSFNNTYVYDDFGQLIRENNKSLDKTFVYVYDNIGNITSVKTYGYTTGDISGDPTREDSFTYHSTVKDRLTKFNNISISYDSNGCPSYYDKNYAWTKGKLSRIYKGSAHQPGSLYEDCVFTYDAYGRRLSKSYTRDPNTASTSDYSYTYNTNYTYDNSGRLIRERCVEAYTYSGGGTNTRDITYLYDESGIVGAIQKLGSTEETFYFDRNIKGDVIGIFNSSGTKVASYSYDAWGNCTTKTLVSNNFSSYNPIRYRGYYYDRETKLYYLNARYYNPEWRRFISPDSTDYLDPESVNGLNLYAYCGNDPVNYADPSGNEALPNWLKWVIGGVAFAGAVALTALTGGALAPMFIQMSASIVLGGLIEGTVSAIRGENFWEGFANGAANGALTGGVLALGQSIFRVVKIANYASRGLTIGKKGTFEVVGKMTGTAHYGGLKSHGFLKKLFGTNFADKVGWIQNKSVIKGVMKFKGVIYDCGGELTGAYAKEIALTKGYEYFVNIWLL